MRITFQAAIIALAMAATARAAGSTAKPINDPGELVASYIEMGLPMPPADAAMLQLESGVIVRNGGEPRPILHLAFVLEKAGEKEPPLVLVGTERFRCRWQPTVINPKRVDADAIIAEWSEGGFEINAALATAIQCRARGLDDLATSLQAVSLKQDVGHHFSRFRQPANLPPRTALAYLAWSHWRNELAKPGTDRAAIANRFKALIAAEPKINDDAHQELLRALEETCIPSNAKPGSVEALIDSLVDFPHESRVPKGEIDRDEPNPRILEIALRAFEAIPALIEHLDDKRLTRGMKGGIDNAPIEHARLGNVVEELIEELAASEMERDYVYRFHQPGGKKTAATPWWERAKTQNEEAYFLSHVLPPEGNKRGYPYLLLLRVIREKYPTRLPEIFLTVLEKRRDVAIHYVAKEVMRSSLTHERKLELFTRAADSEDLEQRRVAYWQLKDLDPAAFAARLVKTIEGLPRTPEEPYWHCREGTFATLATQTDDPRVWKALTEAAKRADVWLRMQYLKPMSSECKDAGQRRCRLEFLTVFLDDAEVRQAQHWHGMPDTKSKFFGPFAGAVYDRIEVRDFAAMEAAYLLAMPDMPTSRSNWAPDQWAEFRASVKAAVQKELAKR